VALLVSLSAYRRLSHIFGLVRQQSRIDTNSRSQVVLGIAGGGHCLPKSSGALLSEARTDCGAWPPNGDLARVRAGPTRYVFITGCPNRMSYQVVLSFRGTVFRDDLGMLVGLEDWQRGASYLLSSVETGIAVGDTFFRLQHGQRDAFGWTTGCCPRNDKQRAMDRSGATITAVITPKGR